MIDDRGSILDANPATETIFGYTAEELLGINVKVLMPSPYREEHDGYLANYLISGEKKIIGTGREVTGRRKDGACFPMHLAVSEVQIGSQRLFTGIVRDISDLKEAERRLELLNENLEARVRQRTKELREAQAALVQKEKLAMLGQVSGGIAHEIRNPLNAVKTSAFYLMNAREPSAEKTREHLERIDRQVSMIDNVITALSDVAKLPEPQLLPYSIVECIQQILKTTQVGPGIAVKYDVKSPVPDVMMDAHQMPIVFRNLVRNARDAMPDGGTLHVKVYKSGEHVTIEVIDSGVGIAQDDLSRITEPLFSTKARGMGLGLAICKAILEKNRGHMEIESELAVGSTFRVRLTAAANASVSAPESE